MREFIRSFVVPAAAALHVACQPTPAPNHPNLDTTRPAETQQQQRSPEAIEADAVEAICGEVGKSVEMQKQCTFRNEVMDAVSKHIHQLSIHGEVNIQRRMRGQAEYPEGERERKLRALISVYGDVYHELNKAILAKTLLSEAEIAALKGRIDEAEQKHRQ